MTRRPDQAGNLPTSGAAAGCGGADGLAGESRGRHREDSTNDEGRGIRRLGLFVLSVTAGRGAPTCPAAHVLEFPACTRWGVPSGTRPLVADALAFHIQGVALVAKGRPQ